MKKMTINSEDRKARWRARNRDKCREINARWRAANPEYSKLRAKLWRQENPDAARENTKKWARANPEKISVIRARCRNKDPEKHKAWTRDWQRKNPDLMSAYARRRYEGVKYGLKIMTPWEKAQVKSMYIFCSYYDWLEVDHIIPLKGRGHSGLHVLSNLQILDKETNRSKSNKVCAEHIKKLEQELPVLDKTLRSIYDD